MMRFLQKTLILFLAFLFIGYAGGINIATHSCNGEIVAKAINAEVKECKNATRTTDFGGLTSFHKKSCCDNEIGFYQTFSFEKHTSSLAILDSQPIANYLDQINPVVYDRQTIIAKSLPPP